MRYLIVDDREVNRDARQMWLLASAGTPADLAVTSCDTADFEQARALGERWRDYDCLVVDAHDDRSEADRAERAAEADVPYRSYDRFPGREVVLLARRHHPGMLIIATSYYAATEPAITWQFAEARADFLFGGTQVSTRASFVAVVRNPRRHEEALREVRARSRRTAEIQDLLAAATDEEVGVLIGAPGRPGPRPRSRRLNRMNDRLKTLLEVPDMGGGKATYRQHMTRKLRSFLGLDLPTMDDPGSRRPGDMP